MNDARAKGFRVCYLDELHCSQHTIERLAWSNKYRNIEVSNSKYYFKPIHIVCAISMENGLEAIQIHSKHINSKLYSKIFKEIEKNGPNWVILADQLVVHWSKYTTRKMVKANTVYIRNCYYSPFLNPIEMYFNVLKKFFRQNRLQVAL